MHIADGILSMPVLLGGFAITVSGLAIGLKELDKNRIMPASLLAAAFFACSLIHLPLGPLDVHLMLNGVLCLILGWAAVPVIFTALLLQTMLFQFGGITALGVNTAISVLPGILYYYLFRGLLKAANSKLGLAGFLTGFLSVLTTTVLGVLTLFIVNPDFLSTGLLILAISIPTAVIEGIMSALLVRFIVRERPELLGKWQSGYQPEIKNKVETADRIQTDSLAAALGNASSCKVHSPLCRHIDKQNKKWLFTLDPRYKFLSVLCLLLSIAVIDKFSGAIISLLLGFGLLMDSRITFKELRFKLFIPNILFFILLLSLSFPVFRDNNIELGSGFFKIFSAEGCEKGLLILLKGNAMLLLLLLLTSTTSITALGQALRALKMPEKLCLLFFFTHRQLHSISELYQRMQAAAKLRCFEPKLNYKSIKTLANLGIKLILQSLVRSESIEKAMRLRLFSGVFPCIYAFKATNKDKICLLCSFCLALLLLYLDRILI